MAQRGSSSPGAAAALHVNGLFLTQSVTGQQRYAREVARRLLADPSVRLLAAPSAVAGNPLLAHAWATVVTPLQSARGALLSMTARSPVLARRHVLVVHDLFPVLHPEWYRRSYAASHAAQLRLQMRTATVLAAVSEPVAEQLRERYPRKRVVLAPNAPAECFTADPPGPSPVPDGQDGEFLLAVGTLEPRKNFALLLRAYASLPLDFRVRYPLWIAGGTGGAFATAGVDPSATDGTIRLLGYVDDAQLADLYRRAAAVVVPSLAEGFGLPLVEALAAGAAVVASDIPVFRWVAGSLVSYFDATSEEDLARALTAVVSTPPPADRRAAAGASVRERFTWERTAATLLAELRSLS